MKVKRYEGDHNHLPVEQRPPTEVGYNFRCPGCGWVHSVRTEGGEAGRPRWSFNGDIDAPTFDPSIFVKTVMLNDANREAYDALTPEQVAASIEDPRFKFWCHSFVRAGSIQFLGDCSHHLAGQTVPLPDWPNP